MENGLWSLELMSERAIYIISRHPAAQQWIREQGYSSAKLVHHVDDEFWLGLQEGDVVVGTLPIHLAAKACTLTGNSFGFLSLFIPQNVRDRNEELSLEQMKEFGAAIGWYKIEETDGPHLDDRCGGNSL